MCDRAKSIFASDFPSKRQRKCLIETAESLLELQNSVVMKIPDLIPDECTQYALKYIRTMNDYEMKAHSNISAPRSNTRIRIFEVDCTAIFVQIIVFSIPLLMYVVFWRRFKPKKRLV